MNAKSLLAAGVMLLCALGAAAAAPTSQPASAKADFSSPLATLRTNKWALAHGDAALLKHCYYSPEKDEQVAIDTIMESWALLAQFQQACVMRFGEGAGERVAPGFNLTIPADANEEIDGDSAILRNIGGPEPTHLRRINGEWRITYPSLVANNFRDLPSLTPPRLKQVFQLSVDLYRGLCDDVSAGKFATIDDAAAAQRERQQATVKQMREILQPGN